MIVTIANAKGGVAKTTSAIYLAAAYARRFEEGATVLDADPQSSASLWRDMAEENGGWPAGTDVMPANLSTLQRLARAGHGGFAVVDAPPQGRLFEESVKAADFVVVPTSDSPIDLQQAWATMNAIPDGKPGAVLIVRAEPRTRAFQLCASGRTSRPAWGTPPTSSTSTPRCSARSSKRWGRAHEEPRHGFQARSPHPQRLRHGRRLPLRSDGGMVQDQREHEARNAAAAQDLRRRARHAHPGGHRPRARSLSRMTRDAVRNKQVPEPERCRAPPAAA